MSVMGERIFCQGTLPDRRRACPPRALAMSRSRAALTLVELLVAVSVILILLAILLPVISRAREQARRVICASNLHQIAIAWTAYAHANNGLLPAAAEGGITRPHDFLVWYLPITQEKLDSSALAPYLGRPLNPAIFRCPSDDWAAHTYTNSMFGPYLFSYSMNVLCSNTGPVMRRDPKLKIWQIHEPSEKIIMVEEDERIISDGIWAPRAAGYYCWLDEIANRHQGPDRGVIDRENWRNTTIDDWKHGNAFFADGHVDFVSGTYAYDLNHLRPWQ
jgi:prepilin-type processing-associated H-X9-DG protein